MIIKPASESRSIPLAQPGNKDPYAVQWIEVWGPDVVKDIRTLRALRHIVGLYERGATSLHQAKKMADDLCMAGAFSLDVSTRIDDMKKTLVASGELVKRLFGLESAPFLFKDGGRGRAISGVTELCRHISRLSQRCIVHIDGLSKDVDIERRC